MKGYLFLIMVSAAVTFLVTPAVRRLASGSGMLSPVRDRDVHAQPTARMGGFGMLLGVLAAWAIASNMPWMSRIFERNGEAIQGLLMAVVFISLLGVADDIWGLDAVAKLAGQALAASAVVWKGIVLQWVPLAGLTLMSREVLAFISVLLIVVTINAVNFIDGLDGLAAGVVGIAGGAYFLYSYVLTRVITQATGLGDYASLASMILAAMVGACIGFLPHNTHPARLFMGDSGSMLLGLMLGTSMIAITGQMVPQMASQVTAFPILLPLLLPIAVLALPLLDLGWAIFRRTAAGLAPWSPDKKHLHHRLMGLGHSHRGAVFVMYSWTATAALGTVALGLFPWWMAIPLGIFALAFALGYTIWPSRVRFNAAVRRRLVRRRRPAAN